MRYVKPLLFGVFILVGMTCWFVWQMWGLRPVNPAPAVPSSANAPEAVAEDREDAPVHDAPDEEIEEAAAEEPDREALPEMASADWPDMPEPEMERHYLRVRPDAVTHAPLEEELRQGASALAKNDLAAAARHFSALAAREPRHPEALLGLAGVAMRQGNLPEARARYQAALTARPHDARAEAGMVALMAETGEGEPEIWESRLRQIIAKQPDSASPYFVLGNLLAGQKRWREAELAYFEASRLEANNPDYRFNLAVSLDALRQKKQAAEHYRAALLAAETLPAAFDPAVAKNRLLLLEAEEDAP